MSPTFAQAVDPAVSREKFDREIAEFRAQEEVHRRRGWWLLHAEFPTALVVMAAPQLMPPVVVCGVRLDFTNYDLEPPSVVLVDPFTGEPYTAAALPVQLHRRRTRQFEMPGAGMVESSEVVPLMQSFAPDGAPFLCIRGVREYHANPAHTGDPWLAHRGRGEGTLFAILNTIHKYGVEPLNGFSIGLQITGFRIGEVPL